MNGILVYQQIRALIEEGFLVSNPSISPAQIQPSSLDLRLATRGYRVRSGFLPENCRVADRLEETTLYTFDLTKSPNRINTILFIQAYANIFKIRIDRYKFRTISNPVKNILDAFFFPLSDLTHFIASIIYFYHC